ncbi:MAG: NAD(+)/NADH kinase [Lachnospiraceae bacterium]|nr:NAD(+)/NADH kinase [Lachnospiraceae bacterium]
MNKFFILANNEKDPELEKTKAIAQFLELRGKKCNYLAIERICEDEGYNRKVAKKIDDDTDLVLVLGGDGTLIQVAGILSNKDIPLLGINMGNLGFLAEVEKENIFEALDKLLNDEYEIEERMMLAGEVTLSGMKMNHNHALNDIIISRNGAIKVASFNIYVNQKLLYSVDADGIVISTPTGSTAYNLSAGGPIVAPYAECIIITPICAHSINLRPIILSKDDEVKVELCMNERNSNSSVAVSFDGGAACPLNNGDSVDVKRSYSKTRIVKLSKANFFDVLSRKMAEK